MTTRRLIRTDGTEVPLDTPQSISSIQRLIGAECLDVVQLRHLGSPAWVMLVDDTGMIDGRPVNAKATEMYHANCRPGTPYQIHGDVVIALDGDFGSAS